MVAKQKMAKTDIKKSLQTIIEQNPPKDMFTRVAAKAMAKERYDKVALFDFDSPYFQEQQFVMVNMNASAKELESGCVFNDAGEIIGFTMSNDSRQVSVNSNARFLVLDSLLDESALLRLKSIAKNDCTWIIHHVRNEENGTSFPDNFCNHHSHGMRAYTHKDFQIVLDIGDEVASYIINCLCEKVVNGETLTPGQIITGVYNHLPVKLIATKEAGRPILRILIPDDNGLFPGDIGCAAPYCDQTLRIRDE